jgi:aromatic-L-amino-acid decarboxylase
VGSDELNERLLERVNAAGRVYMSHTRLHDRYVLRFAVGHADTNDADVRLAWEELNTFAEELEAA